MSKGNTIGGDSAGRDINKNIYNFSDPPDLDEFFEEIDKKVNDILEKGVYSYKHTKTINFNSSQLFDSLMRISIPYKVVSGLLKRLPDLISKSENLQSFSTREIRVIIYKYLQKLDYSIYGNNVDLWGENYIRKYGNPNVEIMVFLEEESRVTKLSYEFLQEKLIPDVYFKCYHSNIVEDLELINSKFIIGEMAKEIFEKVRILNLYIIRYSTLKKLAYDMAIQPPHPWFTNKLNAESHLEYHKKRYDKHFNIFNNGDEPVRSSREFIEHSCAAILSRYDLFIGLGRYRPLITLINYIKLNDKYYGNLLYWQSLDISNISGDIFSSGYSFHKFKNLLDKIIVRIKDPLDAHDELKNHFKEINVLTNRVIEVKRKLEFLATGYKNVQELKDYSLYLFSLYEKMICRNDSLKFKCIETQITDLSTYVGLGYIYDDKNVIMEELNISSNSIVVITKDDIPNYKTREIVNTKLTDVDLIFQITYQELYLNTITANRRIRFEELLNNNIV